MKTAATRWTSLLSGAGTALASRLFGLWARTQTMKPSVALMTHLAVYLIIWGAPIVFFVFGFDTKRWEPDYIFGPEYHAQSRDFLVRGLFWFVAAVMVNLALAFRI